MAIQITGDTAGIAEIELEQAFRSAKWGVMSNGLTTSPRLIPVSLGAFSYSHSDPESR